MNSLNFHINGVLESIRTKDYVGVIRNCEVALDLMDRVELRPTLDRIEKCLARLESLGHSDPETVVSEKDKILNVIEELIQNLNQSSSMSPA